MSRQLAVGPLGLRSLLHMVNTDGLTQVKLGQWRLPPCGWVEGHPTMMGSAGTGALMCRRWDLI
jgi:hypothetical protein